MSTHVRSSMYFYFKNVFKHIINLSLNAKCTNLFLCGYKIRFDVSTDGLFIAISAFYFTAAEFCISGSVLTQVQ